MEHGIYKIKEIAAGVWQIEEYGVFCYLIVGEKRALLIDTGTGFGDLAEAVRSVTDKPLDVAATHAHPDHIGGRGCFPQLYLPWNDRKIAKFYGTLFMRRLMFGKKAQELYHTTRKEIKKGKYRTRYLPLSDGDRFDLGGRTVRCTELRGHTKGGAIFLLEEEKLLFSGDNLCRALWMFLPGAATVEEWIGGAEKAYALLTDYTAYSAHDAQAQDKELIAKLISTAKTLTATRKNTIFPRVKVFPEQYTDHGILYNTAKVRAKKKGKHN